MCKNKHTLILLAAVAFLLASCSDWTRPESMEIEIPGLENNKELWQEYLASLREYKNSDHKVMIVRFNNSAEDPISQVERISALPDSVDYVILQNPNDIHGGTAKEMSEARCDKGTKFLFSVDFDDIKAGYDAYLKEWEEANAGQPEGEDEEAGDDTGMEPIQPAQPLDLNSFITVETTRRLEGKAEVFDGIVIAYNGVSPTSMPEAKKEIWRGYQNSFFAPIVEWIEANKVDDVLFNGIPQNILYEASVFDYFDYVIVDNLDAVSVDALTFNCKLAIDDWLPEFRMIVDVMFPSVTELSDQRGWFAALGAGAEKTYAVDGASLWVLKADADLDRAGVCVTNAQHDYYHNDGSYKIIRRAISKMNWAPAL